MLKPGTILITGAGGFIGGALAEHYLTKGWKVFGLVRRIPETKREGVSYCQFELRSPIDATLLRGVDVLVHAAYVRSEHAADASLEKALNTALDAWSIGHMSLGKEDVNALPERTAFAQHRQEQVGANSIEAAVLERKGAGAIRYRLLSEKEARDLIGD